MNIIGISALFLTLVFFIVNLYLISKKVDKGTKIIETPEGVNISGNLNNIDGNISTKGLITAGNITVSNVNYEEYPYDIWTKKGIYAFGDIKSDKNIYSMDHIIAEEGLESKAHISAVGTIESDKEVYAKNFILQNRENDVISNRKHVLAVGEDNKIYKNNELWSDSYKTGEPKWLLDTERNSVLNESNKKKGYTEHNCEPNKYACGIRIMYSQDPEDLDKTIKIKSDLKCCNFPEGFPKPTAKVNIVRNNIY